MQLTTTLTLLSLLSPILALDYISTYNLGAARWDATLTDTPNNITCTVTYNNIASLLIADSDGYLSSAVAIVMPCSNLNAVATTVVGKESSSVSYTVPGGEKKDFVVASRTLLDDGEVIMMSYGA
ncbi:hypothetical protein BOTCAL_0188g00140 [Botryotinia calthae]|uniref:Uncharacterized protein n=1 Tax=Botryotinia calthae TaxID=38488 RepID=A0A4Y8D0P7_9HELO|nr:hypothetical protein BOTCAL_0188g00140 [Botryotinia calthae]